MKTIQIPLELAETALSDIMDFAERVKDEWGYSDEPIEEYLPDSYHQLKKLVDEQIAIENKIIEVSSYIVKNGKLVLIKKDI